MSIENVRKVFLEKIEKQRRPEFFPFVKPGDYVIGKVVYTYQSDFGDPNREPAEITVIKAIDPEIYKEKLFSLPHNAMLTSGLKRENVEIEDYVMVVYDGEAQTKRKFPVKLFSVAKMTEEEFVQALKAEFKTGEKMLQKLEPPQTVKPSIQPSFEQESSKTFPERTKIPEEKTTEKPQPVSPLDEQTLHYAVSLTKDLLEFYESMTIAQLEESLRSAGVEISISQVLEHTRDFAEVKDGTIKIKH